MDISDLLQALQDAYKRAERLESSDVVASYVDDPTLVAALTSQDHGIVYGRRGTGKTHAFRYLAATRRAAGDIVVYIDLNRDLGSTGSLYSDGDYSTVERATRLLIDVIGTVHQKLLDHAFNDGAGPDISLLDQVLDNVGEIVVKQIGEAELTSTDEKTSSQSRTAGFKLAKAPELNASGTGSADHKSGRTDRGKVSGPVRSRVHFGAVAPALTRVVEKLRARRVWLILDEWNAVPVPLQPYLAEMFRRIFFAIPKVTVRIAAIPHRTEWRINSSDQNYIGIEVGAEIFQILDLDEFGLFLDGDPEGRAKRASHFYGSLLLKHVNLALAETGDRIGSVDELEGMLFAEAGAIAALADVAGGVPRDVLSIAASAAQFARGGRIAIRDIREGAQKHFRRAKAAQLNSNPRQRKLLERIVESVSRNNAHGYFLLPERESGSPLIRQLIDDRLLHLIRPRDTIGGAENRAYDLLRVDYGGLADEIDGLPSGPSDGGDGIPRLVLDHGDPLEIRVRVESPAQAAWSAISRERHEDHGIAWRASSRGRGGGVLVGFANGEYFVRDSKNPDQAAIAFTKSEWDAFVQGVTAGEFRF